MDNSLKEQVMCTLDLEKIVAKSVAKSVGGDNKYYNANVYDKSIDNSVNFSLNGDYVERIIPMPEVGNNVNKFEKVMDKKTFIECYEKWVVQEGE